MSNPLLLYSINTVLAYCINEKYYQGEHYVWCAPWSDAGQTGGGVGGNPPTSAPHNRYSQFLMEATTGDQHGLYIAKQKMGLRNGAEEKRKAGCISEEQRDEILYVVKNAPLLEFRPLIYIMAYADVKDILKPAPVRGRANALSQEYIIECLPNDKFEWIKLWE